MESALVLVVPEVAPIVDRWRVHTLDTDKRGVPAHLTALYPWFPAPTSPEQRAALRTVVATERPVALTFDRLDRFSTGVLFLALSPECDAAVREFLQLIMRAFPECRPYHGEHPDPHPHLTVAVGTDQDLDANQPLVQAALAPVLPLTVVRHELVVMEQQPDRSWLQAHTVPIGAIE